MIGLRHMSDLRLGIFAILLLFVNCLTWANNDLIDVKENQPHWYAALGVGDSLDYRARTGRYLFDSPTRRSITTILPSYNATPISLA